MSVDRRWVTPLVLALFAILGVTGILMFFHLDTGLNQVAHEWLGWALITAVALHAVTNAQALKMHFARTGTRIGLALGALVLALSFVPIGGADSEPPFVGPMRSLAQAPWPVLAQVANVDADTVRQRLAAQGLHVRHEQDSVAALAGGDLRRQMQVLAGVLKPGAAAAGANPTGG